MAHSPFQSLPRLTRAELAESCTRPAAERRLQLPHFVETFRWESIRPLLPLQLPTPGEAPVWCGRVCRSYYQWWGIDDLPTSAEVLRLDEFDLLLRLFDFSPWRPYPGPALPQPVWSPAFRSVEFGTGHLAGTLPKLGLGAFGSGTALACTWRGVLWLSGFRSG